MSPQNKVKSANQLHSHKKFKQLIYMTEALLSQKYGFLFDLDGVLIDSEGEYSKIWAQVNREYPSGIDNLEEVIKGCTLDKILADHYPDKHIQEKVVARLYELEGRMHYEYLPGARSLLQSLAGKGIPAVLVTSSNDDKMLHLDSEIPEMKSFFSFVVTANLISRSKPDPEGYLLGALKIGCKPENCVVFEDSIQGVKAGRSANAYVVGVVGTNSRESLEPYSDMVVDSLEEVDVNSILNAISNKNDK